MRQKLWLILMAVVMCLTLGYGQSAAVQIVPGGIGDELDGLYDMRVGGDTGRNAAGWQNFIVIENTSGNWTAVDLRFRAHKCSVEVWDKVILLSPFDVFWLALENDGSGGINIFSADYDTLLNSGLTREVGVPYEGTFSRTLMDEVCDGSSLDYGHIEIIGLFQLSMPRGWIWEADEHVLSDVVLDLYPQPGDGGQGGPDGLVNVYDLMQAAYYEFNNNLVPVPGDGWITRRSADLRINLFETPPMVSGIADFDRRRVLDCANVLTGNFIWGDTVTAEMGMENFIAMTDFRLNDPTEPPWQSFLFPILQPDWSFIHRDGHYSGAIVFPPQNVYREALPGGLPGGLAPDYFYTWAPYLNPDFGTYWGATLRDGDALCRVPAYPVVCVAGFDTLRTRFNDVWSHIDVDWAYAKTEIWYNYFQEEPFGLGSGIYTTDVYFAFKTKYLNSISCWFPFWNGGDYIETPDGVDDYHLDVGLDRMNNCYCNLDEIRLSVTVWDMDENMPPLGPEEPSPGVWRWPLILTHEMNILRFSTDPGELSNPTVFYSPFTMGHFRVDDMRLFDFRYDGQYPVPDAPAIYGLVYFRHTFGVEDFIRSAMAEWHYRLIGGSPCGMDN